PAWRSAEASNPRGYLRTQRSPANPPVHEAARGRIESPDSASTGQSDNQAVCPFAARKPNPPASRLRSAPWQSAGLLPPVREDVHGRTGSPRLVRIPRSNRPAEYQSPERTTGWRRSRLRSFQYPTATALPQGRAAGRGSRDPPRPDSDLPESNLAMRQVPERKRELRERQYRLTHDRQVRLRPWAPWVPSGRIAGLSLERKRQSRRQANSPGPAMTEVRP